MGEEEIQLTREALGWEWPPFEIPEDVYQSWDCRKKGEIAEKAWSEMMNNYRTKYPELAMQFELCLESKLPSAWNSKLLDWATEIQGKEQTIASRNASGELIAKLDTILPNLIGGSADLSSSNCTSWPDARPLTSTDCSGNYIFYGVREFGMTAITNGIALHGGLRPFSGTFLVFMEYARNAVRMSALMKIPNIFVYTHDSIGQGEDGPTHQPVEQLSNLRSTPNMNVWRPCDAVETVFAWKSAIENLQSPTSLVFSRQGLPTLSRDGVKINEISKGGYIIFEPKNDLDCIIIATGSEVALAVKVAEGLEKEGVFVRVVSMPCVEMFESQDLSYRDFVLPPAMDKRIAIEASHPDQWYKFVGREGRIIGIQSFGSSAPGPELMQLFGFTEKNVKEVLKEIL